MSKRRGRRTKRRAPVGLIIVIVLICIVIGAGIFVLSITNKGSEETVDLNSYYKLTAHTVTDDNGEKTEYAEPNEDEIAIVLDQDVLDERAVLQDNIAYLPYSVVRDKIDSRFYYDYINNILIVTNATQKITSESGESGYAVDGEAFTTEHPVSMIENEQVYISTEFVDKFSSAESVLAENPGRVYVKAQTGTVKEGTIASNTQIREAAGNKNAIVAEVSKGTEITVYESEDGWAKVVDASGYVGYVSDGKIQASDTERVSSYEEPEYTHILADGKINMLWYGVYYWGQDAEIQTEGAEVTGINVISPRWYSLNDTEGGIEVYSNSDFMTYASEKGWQVWAMIDDVDQSFVDAVLVDSNKRDAVINTIVTDAVNEGVKGLNVDFERITTETGDDFIEFIRELSIKCRQQGLILSVDNYTPYSYNDCYHVDEQNQCVDYVTIMAYDNYLGTDTQGPNSSVDFLNEVMEVTLEKADEDRLIIGLPFYSRIWYTATDGTVSSEEYTMADTKSVIEANGGSWAWDDSTGMNYASFDYDGGHINCWIEDADSIKAKLDFLSKYNIAGVAWWTLGQETSDVWAVISQYY